MGSHSRLDLPQQAAPRHTIIQDDSLAQIIAIFGFPFFFDFFYKSETESTLPLKSND